MSFSKSQYEAMTESLRSGLQQISDELPRVVPAAESALNKWYIPKFVQDEAIAALKNATIAIDELRQFIEHLMEGILAPLYFYDLSWKWDGSHVRGAASTVSADIKPVLLEEKLVWNSSAAARYKNAISLQSPAVTQIVQIADSTANSLTTCATAGVAFYVALAALVMNMIEALPPVFAAAAQDGLDPITDIWAFVKLSNTALSATRLGAAVVTLSAVLAAQAAEMKTLYGNAADNSNFPNGNWPSAAASSW